MSKRSFWGDLKLKNEAVAFYRYVLLPAITLGMIAFVSESATFSVML